MANIEVVDQEVVRFSEDEQAALWEMFEAGVPYKKIGRVLGRGHLSVRKRIMYGGKAAGSPGAL